ncbi:hypothetical protein D4764_19G0001310 [Takifugu flavidus]|uniref:Uncharacterized protein n=1 Tax=Takifugu flavidus TaxID=433684 RepID=A0A5C6NM85_9TELE|nr:hypothetical protein D4764_19G0001310 [Takifugu flavidus]
MIKEEVEEGLDAIFSGSPQKTTTSCSLNSMILIVSNVMKKFAKRVKKFLKLRKVKQRKESPVDTADAENAFGDGGPQSSLVKELNEMVTPILDIVPERDYEGVFTETATEIQALSEDIATILSENKEKKNPLKLFQQKITHFFAKCFLNAWIRRLISQLRKQHPRLRRGKSSESVRSLVVAVTSLLDNDTSLVDGFQELTSSHESVFHQSTSELLYSHLLAETGSKDTEWNERLYADIQKKAWKIQGLVNGFLKDLVFRFTEKVKILSPILGVAVEGPAVDNGRRVAVEDLSEASELEEELEDTPSPHSDIEQAEELDTFVCEEEPREEAPVSLEKHRDSYAPPSVIGVEPQQIQEMESMRAFVQFLIEKIINHIYDEANIVPQYNDEVLSALLAHIWPRVWDSDANLSLTEKSFKKMDKMIHKAFCKKLGNPNQVLFMLKYSEESIIEEHTVRIAKELLRPSKKLNIFQRLCCFLG